MKLGILGTGMIVKNLMQVYNTFKIEETYVLGTPATKVETENLVADNELTGTYYDYDEMLASDIDTIYNALPNFLHYSFAKKAIEAGKHVIIEKPITSNARELKELISLAEKHQVMIFEAMNIHYLPAFQSLKENLYKVGNIKIVNFNYSQYSSRYNAFKEGTILPAFDYHKSGGALMDINVYNVHAMIGLFGKPENAKYSANIEKNIDTSGIMQYQYKDFLALSIGAKDCKAPIRSTIQGDQGVIVIETPFNTFTSYKFIGNDGFEEVFEFEKIHRLTYEFHEFIRMIKEKDFVSQKEILNTSLIISELMEKTRKEAGIVFDADR